MVLKAKLNSLIWWTGDWHKSVPTLEDIIKLRKHLIEIQGMSLKHQYLTMLSIEDLKEGMKLSGMEVRNVVDLGTFIDIGVKQDGLIHALNFQEVLKIQWYCQCQVIVADAWFTVLTKIKTKYH